MTITSLRSTSTLSNGRVFDDVGFPMTVHQIFYRLVSVGAVSKLETSYRKVVRHLLTMRRLEHQVGGRIFLFVRGYDQAYEQLRRLLYQKQEFES